MLVSRVGEPAARALPGVDNVLVHDLPWIVADPEPVDRRATNALVRDVERVAPELAVIFTSFHQSALPLALLLRLAGVGRISAISDDYPGSLLDVRHRVPAGIPEPERALSLAVAAGFAPPPGDDLRLRVTAEGEPQDFVVVHPGASVPARAAPPPVYRDIVSALSDAGHSVVVTGGPDERDLTAYVAGRQALDLGGS